MNDIERLYRKQFFHPLFRFVARPSGTFFENLINSEFLPDDRSDGTKLVFEMNGNIYQALAGLANESSIWALALNETIIDIKNSTSHKSLAWQFVKFYYAAFYSAQILMRLYGRWPTRQRNLPRFIDLFETYHGKRLEIQFDTFICEFHDDRFHLTGSNFDQSKSHRSSWLNFSAFLESISHKILKQDSGIDGAHELVGELTNLILDLGGQNSPFLLSDFRNELNYKMLHGIWYPQSREANRDWQVYLRILNLETNAASAPRYSRRTNSRAQTFLGCCAYIVKLACWSINEFTASQPQNKFLKPQLTKMKNSLESRVV